MTTAKRNFPARRSVARHIAGAGLIAVAAMLPVSAAMTPAKAQTLSDVSVADIAEGLLPSVVNISISEDGGPSGDTRPLPDVPEGQPFEDLFKDFFEGEEGPRSRQYSSLGSGFIIDPSGIIVTNNHVIDNADTIEVTLSDGTSLDATLLGVDDKTDLAVLKVEPEQPLPAVKFGDSRKVRIGEWVLAIGNPFGLGGSVTLGIVSARGRELDGPYDNFIQTDAAINKGNSGGPLFNMDGEVIGINTAILSPSGGSIGIGFSVPSELAENIIDQLIEYGQTRRGWIGIRVLEVSDALAASLGADDPAGVAVGSIIEGGPSDGGPLEEGDIILSFDGQEVDSPRDLPRFVAEGRIGEPIDVEIIRDGERMTVQVTPQLLEEPEEVEATLVPDDEPAPEGDLATPGLSIRLYGMTLAELDDNGRALYQIDGDVEGVLIAEVEEGSAAAAEGLVPGMVIAEVGQDAVTTPQQVRSRIVELISEGRRSVSIMVAEPDGTLSIKSLVLE
ncbi:Do family serine endopeptidase [Martelella lutilitoris]|uniref:Probable periplasmic serine endoprotease DegP-like n=1 Tax=Martelella lutilitoris TaxID=2583532 RepID=A0A5C4JMF7_9HYPH|nr:Do family serine endopeptidase [Martelella lutilitoris]TNB46643.1 Do family serine endopeptidase [Martelella lutilitoris]